MKRLYIYIYNRNIGIAFYTPKFEMMRSVFTVCIIYFGDLNVADSFIVLNISFTEMLICRYNKNLHVAI